MHRLRSRSYAGGKTKSNAKPSAGMTGIKAGNTPIQIVGYGCGNDTVPVAVTETKRLMEKLKADVMVGPLSGDEAVYVANYAKAHPTKTFIIGTAGSQDPTMQIAPKNLFRYHGDGAQWNAGIGEIAYKKLGWRKAAIIMDDYSFGWTSAAGMIADFCAVGGDMVKRVFPPLNTTDYAPFVRQLPNPNQVDGYFSAVGGTGTSAMLKAFEQAYGKLDPKQWIGNLFFGFLGADKVVAPKLVGAYVGGAGTGPGLKLPKVTAYENMDEVDLSEAAPRRPVRLQLLPGSRGAGPRAPEVQWPGRREAAGCATSGDPGGVPDRERRSGETRLASPGDPGPVPAPAGQKPRRVRGPDGGRVRTDGRSVVRRSLHAVEPAAGRTQPPCKKTTTPWQGKIKVV